MRTRRRWLLPLWAGCCCLLLLAGLGAVVAAAEKIDVFDDLACHRLEESLNSSLNFLRTVAPSTRYRIAGRSIPARRLLASILHMQRLAAAHPSPEMLAQAINRAYEIIQINDPSKSTSKRMSITGYYQPVVSGCLEQQPPCVHPLYRRPKDLVIRRNKGRKAIVGRLENGTIVPYWTRREIEQRGLLIGQELVWLTDPFDAFTIHVQGSGIIRLPDGSRRGVHYAAGNGHPYRSIGAFMVKNGRMRLTDITMDGLRRSLAARPEERTRILHHNDSFIFFDWSEAGPAIGSMGRPLTPGRSVAADRQWYPPGSLVYIDSRRPVMADNGQVKEWRPMRRLVTVQDTGSAISGPNRIDIFWGTGDQAGREAGQMKEDGKAYLLLLKDNFGR